MSRVSEPAFDQKKFEELVLYLAARSFDDTHFGNTKLNKLLFFADFISYAVHGQPVTGAVYVKEKFGPAPRGMAQVRQRLQDRGDAINIVRPHYDYEQKRLIPLREAEMDRFSGRDIELVNRVIELMRDGSATRISEWSHLELGWQIAQIGQPIPYDAVFLSTEGPTEDDVRWGQELARKMGRAAS